MTTHSHLHTPVRVGQYTVYASAGRSVTKETDYRPKALGIYLDPMIWGRIRDVTIQPFAEVTSKVPVQRDAAGEIIYVRWPDFGIIGQDRLRRLTGIIHRALRDGITVEIGCIGAHGRTGTLLAALLVTIEKDSAAEAIRHVWDSYCEDAIETRGQQRMIYDLANEPFNGGLPFPSPAAQDFPEDVVGYNEVWGPTRQPWGDIDLDDEELDDEELSLMEYQADVHARTQQALEDAREILDVDPSTLSEKEWFKRQASHSPAPVRSRPWWRRYGPFST